MFGRRSNILGSLAAAAALSSMHRSRDDAVEIVIENRWPKFDRLSSRRYRTAPEPHNYPPNPNESRQVRRARERLEKKQHRKEQIND